MSKPRCDCCGATGVVPDFHAIDCDYWLWFDAGVRGDDLAAQTAFLFKAEVDA